MKFIKRWATIVVGGLILVTGVILMPMPGPGGLPVALAGLVILSAELPWARRLLQRVKSRLQLLGSSRLGAGSRWRRIGLVGGLLTLWLLGGIVAWRVWAS